MTSHSDPYADNRVSWIRRGITYAIVLLVGFLIGFVPMWIQARNSANQLSEATTQADLVRSRDALASAVVEGELHLATMQNTLASAAIDAQRGDYESARQAVSSFFTSLREEANKGADSILSQAQRDGVEPLFARRDETISLLARNDSVAAERLSDLYVAFRELLGE
jgi:uncharacterized membrane-anchored protein YhcB (DUF1043 family)